MQEPRDPREPQEPYGTQRPPEAGPPWGPADGAADPAGGPVRTPRPRRSARARALIAATAVAVLALGGTVAYAATSNGSGGGSPSTAPSSSSSEGPGWRHGRGGPWFGPGGDAAHGEATVKDSTGHWVVRVWQRGSVEKADDTRLTVKSEDGASWTWTLGKDTRVLTDGASGSGAAAPKKGDTVFVVGTRSGETNTADRVLSGSFGEHGRDGRGRDDPGPRGGFPGHGPWDRGGRNDSPGPMGSGATT